MKRLLVLIGGNGSNLQAIIHAILTRTLALQCVCVISHNPTAFGIERAKQQNIPTFVVDHKAFTNSADFEQSLLKCILDANPDIIALAGFMRILSKAFIDQIACPILNIHPSLLPLHPGLNTHEKVLAANDIFHGASVHYVTSLVDGGPIVAQSKIPVRKHDTKKTLQERVLQIEHQLYPEVLRWFAEERIYRCDSAIFLSGEQLGPQGKQLTLHYSEIIA